MLHFTKMHGIGNDYIYINGFEETLPADLPALARRMSPRHTSVGSDGLILILPSDTADVRMRMFNPDGSEAEMCGNGIRCVAAYSYDRGLCPRTQMTIETRAGIKNATVLLDDLGRSLAVRVDMGAPVTAGDRIPSRFISNPVHAAADRAWANLSGNARQHGQSPCRHLCGGRRRRPGADRRAGAGARFRISGARQH